ncbi:MAG: response regulator [Nitrospirae bacterium]|nr:response regulator [Nitrospirota bacterium]
MRLAIVFVLLFVLFSSVSIFGVNRISYIASQLQMMYDHPFTVSNAILRIDGDITEVRLIMRRAVYTIEHDEILKYKNQVILLFSNVNRDFDIVEKRFLGDKKLVSDARQKVNLWSPFIEHIFMSLLDNKPGEAQAIINNDKYTSYTSDLEINVKAVYEFALNKAGSFNANAQKTSNDFKNQIYILITITFIFGMILSFIFVRGITRPIQQLISATNEIGAGRLDTVIVITSTDEIGNLAGSFRNMAAQLKATIAEKDRADWKKTGVAQLNDKMRGEQSITLLAQNIISSLTQYLNAQIGAIYLVDNDKTLRLHSTYAYKKRKNISNSFVFGEGLVGQAALERQSILITEAPDDYIKITSGLGESGPVNILVTPFLYEGQVMGVTEIGSLSRFTDTQLEFIESVSPNIAIAFNVARSRDTMRELLLTTQNQAEELQVQQEELRASNEQLNEQTNALKASEAELQSQQEELRQVNEELEERAKVLQKQRDEIKQKNIELEKAQQITTEKAKELEVTSRYKSEFLANMSHELRTPLNSILLLSKHLSDNKENNLSPKQLECAQTVHSSGKDLLALINDILDLSKIESGKVELHIEPLGFKELATSIERTFGHVAQSKGLTLDVVVAQDVPNSIRTDPQKLEQIVRNLISNAIKFTEKGGVTVKISRILNSSTIPGMGVSAENTISISVSDTGIGIATNKQGVIFEAFKQADGTTSRKYGGTGLGLTISRELTRLLGGHLHLKSDENAGSTFTLYIPEVFRPELTQQQGHRSETRYAAPELKSGVPVSLEPLNNKPLSVPASLDTDITEDDRQAIRPGDKTILIIEDDPVFAKILFNISREKGFKCIVAGDGQKGYEYANTYMPDAIILDVGLPVIDGWTVVEHLKDSAQTRNIPVHIISASDKNIECLKSGVIGYITKPVSMEKLDDAFKKLENTFAQEDKKLLAVNLDKTQKDTLSELIGSTEVAIVFVSPEEAHRLLKTDRVNCIILDLSFDEISGFTLLDKLKEEETFNDIPVIIYSKKALSKEAEIKLNMYCHRLIIKKVISNERLLDEIVLFLHLVQSKLPAEKQQMISMVHDKETIFRNKKILLVDDDVRNVFALSSVLEDKGMNVLVGRDGREGIAQLKGNLDVDLVLMDIMMPEMDGYEAIREIRKLYEHRDLPIIALTAKAMKEDKTKCIEAGANDYLAKPIDADRLLSLLSVWLYQ